MDAINFLASLVAKNTRYVCGLVMILTLALIGCGGALPSTSSPGPTASSLRTAVPSVSPTALPTSSPTVVPSPLPPTTVSPSPAVVLPDLSPPPDGWIAFRTPEGRLALVSPDGSRYVRLTWTEQGEVLNYAWSPDGRQIAFTLDSYYLHGLPGVQLALVSLEDSRFITLIPPGAVDGSFTWSQDGRFLAYLWQTNPQEARPPLALRVMDLTTGQVITVTTFSNNLLPEPEIPALCSQPFPYPLLPVYMAASASYDFPNIWDVQTGQEIAALGLSLHCRHVWLPTGEGLFFPKVERGEEGIRIEGVSEEIVYPISLALWRRGDEAPTVVLQASKRQSYEPVQWLSDGRLVVRVMEWEKDEYEGPAEPERVEYRLFSVDEAGGIREAEGDLPWWAAIGLPERLAATGLPQGDQIPRSRLGEWRVGPDDVTIGFTWQWFESNESKSAIYLWRGKGEPIHLAMGMGPQWQPKQTPP